MSDEFSFDVSLGDIAPLGTLMPADWYELKVASFEVNKQEDKPGKHPYINFTFEVLNGDFAGQQFGNNIISLSTESYPRQQLRTFCEAVTGTSWATPKTFKPSEFIGLKFKGAVTIERSSKDGKTYENNKVKHYVRQSVDTARLPIPGGKETSALTPPSDGSPLDLGF